MNTLKIDKNVPLPFRRNATGLTATLRALEVGDSVFVPNKHTVEFSGILSTMRHEKRKMVTRYVVEKNIKGTRVWRTE